MGRLNQYVYIAERLDASWPPRSPPLDTSDPKAKALREDVLFYVRQKHRDLLTQLAVSIQNYLAIDIVIKNNIGLIRVSTGRPRRRSARANRRDRGSGARQPAARPGQITALNTTTSGLIERTSEMPPGQQHPDPGAGGQRDHRPAATAARLPEHLRDHGCHRHLQGAGARQYGGHHRHSRGRGRQEAATSTASSAPTPASHQGSLDLGSPTQN